MSSTGASARYRITLPAQVLADMGHRSAFVTLADAQLADPRAAAMTVAAEVAIVSKFFDPRTIAVVEELKRRHVRIIADFCDNHFGDRAVGPAYRTLAALADRIACNSEAMAEEIQTRVGRKACVIPDPVEGRRNPPRFAPAGEAMKLAWYGFPAGLAALFARLQSWLNRGLSRPISVEIVTAPLPELLAHAAAASQKTRGRCRVHVTPWSTDAVWAAIAAADCVLVPAELNELTRTKSANRLAEAIHGGRLALASPLPSYRELGAFCVFDDDAGAAAAVLDATMGEKNAVQRIAAGQNYIDQTYLPVHAAQAWDRLIRDAG